jgi:hypothetical protein
MSRRKSQPSWGGVPKGITIYPTPDGWRHSILTAPGGFLCGRLAGVDAEADENAAKAAASAMLEALLLDFHDTRARITWTPAGTPHGWNGEVSPCDP